MAIFREAHDFIITGGEFTDQSKTGMNGIQWLHQAIAASAIHDSDERYDPPKCHPETRKVIIDDIMKWIQDRERSMKALWVHGPAGAGKSAIAQTIAELCQEYGLLAASFFFSRTSRDRNSAKRFFSTLAYQLAIAIPKLKERIEKVIEVDPSVVNKSMDIQLKKLILQPLSRIQLSSTQGLPRVIVIDGLDECVEEKHQTDILQFIRMALKEDNFPFCIIITSRPEYHILGEFDSPAYRKIAWRLELNNRIDTREDIRIVLRAGFAKVHDNPTHRYTMASISKPWLTNYSIETLVDRSSGQFVYASTVLKFVDDPDCRPTEQLRVILGLSSSTEGAFPELDKLYSEILSRCRNPKRMLTVLGHVLALTQGNQVTLLSDAMGTGGLLAVVDQLLSLKSGDAFMSLRGLHSLIYIPNPAEPKEGEAGIRFYHASFSDFLMASSRSGQYYIRMRDMHAQITRSCLRILSQRPAKAELDVYLGWAYAVLFWCHHCSRSSFDEALIEDLRCFNPSKDWVLVQTSFSAHVDEKKLRKALEIFGVAHLDGCPGQGRWMPRNPDIFLMSEELRMVLTWFQQPRFLFLGDLVRRYADAINDSFAHHLSQCKDSLGIRKILGILLSGEVSARIVTDMSCIKDGGLEAFLEPIKSFIYQWRVCSPEAFQHDLVADTTSFLNSNISWDHRLGIKSELLRKYLEDPMLTRKYHVGTKFHTEIVCDLLGSVRSADTNQWNASDYCQAWSFSLSRASTSSKIIDILATATPVYLSSPHLQRGLRRHYVKHIVKYLNVFYDPPEALVVQWNSAPLWKNTWGREEVCLLTIPPPMVYELACMPLVG